MKKVLLAIVLGLVAGQSCYASTFRNATGLRISIWGFDGDAHVHNGALQLEAGQQGQLNNNSNRARAHALEAVGQPCSQKVDIAHDGTYEVTYNEVANTLVITAV